MQYVLNYSVSLGDSSEHMLQMSPSSIHAQLYSSHHILRCFPKCLSVNVSDFILNCRTESSMCPRSIIVYSFLKVAPQEEIRWSGRRDTSSNCRDKVLTPAPGKFITSFGRDARASGWPTYCLSTRQRTKARTPYV